MAHKARKAVKSQEQSHLDAPQCGERYGFSARHWIRLVDMGHAPQPVRFGRLTRWPLRELQKWETDNYPRSDRRRVRKSKG